MKSMFLYYQSLSKLEIKIYYILGFNSFTGLCFFERTNFFGPEYTNTRTTTISNIIVKYNFPKTVKSSEKSKFERLTDV